MSDKLSVAIIVGCAGSFLIILYYEVRHKLNQRDLRLKSLKLIKNELNAMIRRYRESYFDPAFAGANENSFIIPIYIKEDYFSVLKNALSDFGGSSNDELLFQLQYIRIELCGFLDTNSDYREQYNNWLGFIDGIERGVLNYTERSNTHFERLEIALVNGTSSIREAFIKLERDINAVVEDIDEQIYHEQSRLR